MKRLLDSNWKRIGLQIGLLAGIGLAFAIGSQGDEATAGPNPDCPEEGDCTFKRPNIMFIMDYSTSMNTEWDLQNNLTRWEVTVAAVQQIVQPNSFLSQNTHLALMRYGHDPSPNPNTTIPGDQSGLVDGNLIDVAWDDNNNVYYPCNGQALIDSLNATIAPMNGNPNGIGTWAGGALAAVAAEIDTTKADHPEDQNNPARAYVNVLLTDGQWTSQDGLTTLGPPGADPAIPAAAMWDEMIPTYVVAVAGDPMAEMAADETALAGGTMAAIDGDTPDLLAEALQDVVQTIIESVVEPECIGGLPRVMVLLDASSSMLNIMGGTQAGAMGETGWDQARSALSAQMGSLFDVDIGIGTVEDVTHLGLAVFGHHLPNPGEQKILVNYGPCMKDNFAWALDPATSCEMPGCDDPWGGPPISWTFKDGQLEDPPGFDNPTESHMPQCAGNAAYCVGSGTYTHLGLDLIKDNQASYHAAAQMMGAQFPANDSTIYFNILITDGQYNMYSTDVQVEAELTQMYNNDITTYVIGFGDNLNSPDAVTQLTNMADWGSGGNEPYFDAANQADLEAALASIFGGLVFDPCCAFNDCSVTPEPTGNEPDPVPPMTTGDGDGDTGDGDGDGDTGDGDGDGDPGDGDGDPGDGDGDPGDGDGDGDGDPGDGDGETNGETFGDEGESGDSGTGTGGILLEDDGCNCSTADTDAGKTRGLLGTFFALGLAGLVRRRRR